MLQFSEGDIRTHKDISIIKNSTAMTRKKTKHSKYPGKKIYNGYKSYPEDEDIYKKSKEETNLDPENIEKTKAPNEEAGKSNEKDFGELLTGEDLDVPGSELDDDGEKIGSEDEENNYYSLGGEDHEDLEEDK